jgi:hypothetical protein
MDHKQLLVVKLHLITVKNKLENKQNVDFQKYGEIMYILSIIDNLLDNYQHIKSIIMKYQLKIIPLSNYDEPYEYFDNTTAHNYLMSFFNQNNNFIIYQINKKLPDIFVNYIYNFYEEKINYDNEVIEMFQNIPNLKLITINKKNTLNDNQLIYFNISFNILYWEQYFNELIKTINKKNYKKILKLLNV